MSNIFDMPYKHFENNMILKLSSVNPIKFDSYVQKKVSLNRLYVGIYIFSMENQYFCVRFYQ